MGDIKIRITAKAETHEEAATMIGNMEREIRNRLGTLIYGVDQETLQGNVARELEGSGLTLSVAETFTGGIISEKLANADSPSFVRGAILPSEVSQRNFLNVSEEEFRSLKSDLKRFTDALAQKARSDFKTGLGLATFAKVAEEQGRGDYRVAAFCSIATSAGMENQENPLGGELWMIRERTSILALDMLRKYLLTKTHSA
jgi:nicotinamide-nucleotide amidase